MTTGRIDRELAYGLDAPLHEVMRTMRAIRRLRPDPLPRQTLEALVEAATWAPSASNAQSYAWVVVTERQVMADLARLWAKCFELYMGTIGTLPPDTMGTSQIERLNQAAAYQRDHFAETPAVIVACYDLSWQRKGLVGNWRDLVRQFGALGWRERRSVLRGGRRAGEMAEAASVYPGIQNLLLTARALGLGATITTWHLMLEREFKRVLGIPPRVKTFALIPVGRPRGKLGPVSRRPAEEAIHWQRWSAAGGSP
jgi:nitroreductase